MDVYVFFFFPEVSYRNSIKCLQGSGPECRTKLNGFLLTHARGELVCWSYSTTPSAARGKKNDK